LLQLGNYSDSSLAWIGDSIGYGCFGTDLSASFGDVGVLSSGGGGGSYVSDAYGGDDFSSGGSFGGSDSGAGGGSFGGW
jgi:hypothetical protein